MAPLKAHWQLLALTALVFALWQTPVVLPLKILVILLHEISHGAAAILTGGTVDALTVSADQGGLAYTRGGNRFAVLTAGYLGSLVIGVAILVLALRTRADRALLAAFGVAMLAIGVIWVRDIFAFAFVAATGAAMLAVARWLPLAACDMVLRVIGLSSLFYVPYDIFDDTIARSALRSDARVLAEEIGGGTVLWGVAWLIISLAIIWFSLRLALGRSSNLDRWH